MRQRWVLIAILVASLVAQFGLATSDPVRGAAGFDVTFVPAASVFWVVVFALAVSGRRFPWALAFLSSAIVAGICCVLALATWDEPVRWAFAGAFAVSPLALWGLRPSEPGETSAPRNQG